MISIIIPTYNEVDNINKSINQISQALNNIKHEIIVVDDNSPDQTYKVVQRLAQKKNNLRLLLRLKQKGLTSAFNHGIKSAQGNVVGWLDADLSHPPELLTQMVKQLKKHDAVVASRYVKHAKDGRGIFLAVFLSKVINQLAKLFLFKDLTDYTSGYILVKKKFLTRPLQGDYGEYFIKLLFDLKKQNASIIELPYVSKNRLYGQSKTATNLFGFINRGYKYLYTIFNLWLKK